MIKNKLKIFIAGIVIIVSSQSWGASDQVGTTAMDYLKLGTSVRAEGLGNAVTALDGIDGLIGNPAAFATATQTIFTYQGLSYIEGISLQQLAGIWISPIGPVGINIASIDLGSQVRTTWTDKVSSDAFKNSGLTVGIAMARTINMIKYGCAVRASSQTLDGQVASAVGVDLGVQYPFSTSLSAGVSVTNITLTRAQYLVDSADLPTTTRLGVATMVSIFDRDIQFVGDVAYPRDDVPYFGIGIEFPIHSNLNGRIGYSSYNPLAHISVGLGLVLGDLSFDFAYKPVTNFGSQYRLGLGILVE